MQDDLVEGDDEVVDSGEVEGDTAVGTDTNAGALG